jgi:TPR repeat protein
VKARLIPSLLAAAIFAAAGVGLGDRPVVAGDGGGTQISEEAVKNFVAVRNRATGGDREAMRQLASWYYTGEAGVQNRLEAARWYRKAAARGDAESMHNLAVMYRYGNGLPVNYAEAVRWETASARKGFMVAQRTLGQIDLHGESYLEATRWLRAAAAQDDVESINELVLFYTTGILFESNFGGVNYDEGLRWMIRAGERGNSTAQANLGLIYERGKNDPVSAYMWYAIAAARGNNDARDHLQALTARMSGPQIAQAQAAATRWWDRPVD